MADRGPALKEEVHGFEASTGTEHRRAAAQSLADFQQGAQRWGSGLPPALSLSPSTCKARSGMRKRGRRFEQSLRQAWVRRHLLLPEFPQRVSPKGSARSLSLLIPHFVQRRTARSRIPSPSHATLRPPRLPPRTSPRGPGRRAVLCAHTPAWRRGVLSPTQNGLRARPEMSRESPP